MKYNRFIALMLVFITLFSLISCKRNNNQNNDNHGHNTNTDNQQQNDQQQQGGEGNVTFYYSVKADKFHIAGCYHLRTMDDDILRTSTSVSDLVAKGYSPCRYCIAVEEGSDEDDPNKITKEEATFVIGTGNNKLHTLDCHNVKKIYDENLEYTNLTIEELMEMDKYAPCKDCLPDEAKIYYEKHPEKDPSNKD